MYSGPLIDGISVAKWALTYLQRHGRECEFGDDRRGSVHIMSHGRSYNSSSLYLGMHIVFTDGKGLDETMSGKRVRICGMDLGNSMHAYTLNDMVLPAIFTMVEIDGQTLRSIAEIAYVEWCNGDGRRPAK